MRIVDFLPPVVLNIHRALTALGYVRLDLAHAVAERFARGATIRGTDALSILEEIGAWSSGYEYGTTLPFPRADAAIFANDPETYEAWCETCLAIVSRAHTTGLWGSFSLAGWSALIAQVKG